MRKVTLYITLFLFAILLMLAGLAAIFPENGVTIGDITLRFPTLKDIWTPKEEVPTISPEELLAQREAELRLEKENEILAFFRTNPAAVRFPRAAQDTMSVGDSTYLDTFFAALDAADYTHVNVIHYGDSQIEEDRISDVLRKNLQADFGGGGIGLVPAYQSIQTRTINQYSSYEPHRSLIYYGNYKREDNKYGPMGQMVTLDAAYQLSIRPRVKKEERYSAHYFSRITVYSSDENNCVVSFKGNNHTIRENNKSFHATAFSVKDSITQATLNFQGQANLYGVSFTLPTGVNIDNIPMRGCSGTIFTQIDAEQLRTYYQLSNTRLIILQYGGNTMPSLYDTKSVDKYVDRLRTQILYLKRQAPEAAFLFIGPSDMTTKRRGKMMTYPLLPELNQKMSIMAREIGIAYWSMYDAMGGNGAMIQWVNSGLAARDFVHFTRKGADEMGKILYESIMACYKYYQFRHGYTIETTNDIESIKDTIP